MKSTYRDDHVYVIRYVKHYEYKFSEISNNKALNVFNQVRHIYDYESENKSQNIYRFQSTLNKSNLNLQSLDIKSLTGKRNMYLTKFLSRLYYLSIEYFDERTNRNLNYLKFDYNPYEQDFKFQINVFKVSLVTDGLGKLPAIKYGDYTVKLDKNDE